MPHRILIYGADRRRGERLARGLAAVGPPPLLGGPDGAALDGLAHALQAGVRIFSHAEPRFAAAGLSGVAVVINAAGRWTSTTPALVEACLHTHTHYIDLCDAWDVLQDVARLGDLALAAGVCLVPGLTFDSVAGDGLAACLAPAAPCANHLELALHTEDGLSRGTVDTIARRLRRGGLIRSAGTWKSQRIGSPRREVDFGQGPQRCMALPLASLSLLARGDRVPNLVCYGSVTTTQEFALRASRHGWFLGPLPFRALLSGTGDDEHAADAAGSVFCELRDDAGRAARALLHTPHTGAFVEAAVLAVARALAGGRNVGGLRTPSDVCGAAFVLDLPDVVCSGDAARGVRGRRRPASPHLLADRA